MKKNILVYASAVISLAVVVMIANLIGTDVDFTVFSLPLELFFPFVYYIFIEDYLCNKFALKRWVFAVCVIGLSFLLLLLLLLVTAVFTRSFDVLEGVGWIGLFVVLAYATIIGLRLVWMLIQYFRNRA